MIHFLARVVAGKNEGKGLVRIEREKKKKPLEMGERGNK